MRTDTVDLGKVVDGCERPVLLTVGDDLAGLLYSDTIDGRGERLGVGGVDVHGLRGVQHAGSRQKRTGHEATGIEHVSLLIQPLFCIASPRARCHAMTRVQHRRAAHEATSLRCRRTAPTGTAMCAITRRE
jgi:hypothetical protein